MNCGISSNEEARSQRPSRVRRSSPSRPPGARPSAGSKRARAVACRMERNFSITKGRPLRPIRCCRKNTGPGEVALTAMAISRNSGESTTRAAAARRASRQCFSQKPRARNAGMPQVSADGVPSRPPCASISWTAIARSEEVAAVMERRSTSKLDVTPPPPGDSPRQPVQRPRFENKKNLNCVLSQFRYAAAGSPGDVPRRSSPGASTPVPTQPTPTTVTKRLIASHRSPFY
jgi:hypothetical protein